MIRDFHPGRRIHGAGSTDAHGLALILVALLLAAGTWLSQFGASAPPFPLPPVARTVTPSVSEDGAPQSARALGSPVEEQRLPNQLDLNAADAEALQTLPGIGPSLAKRIVAEREQNGPFRTAEDLLRVPGIGPKRWQRILPLVRITEQP